MVSEASYVYILCALKLIKDAKNSPFWPEACGQTVLPDRSVLNRTKIDGKCQNAKMKCNILSNFQTMWQQFCVED